MTLRLRPVASGTSIQLKTDQATLMMLQLQLRLHNPITKVIQDKNNSKPANLNQTEVSLDVATGLSLLTKKHAAMRCRMRWYENSGVHHAVAQLIMQAVREEQHELNRHHWTLPPPRESLTRTKVFPCPESTTAVAI